LPWKRSAGARRGNEMIRFYFRAKKRFFVVWTFLFVPVLIMEVR